MAIRVSHQPIGIAGVAAYSTGRGRRKERDRKYATDIILQQQARQDKYNFQANQERFVRERDEQQRTFALEAEDRQRGYRIDDLEREQNFTRQRDLEQNQFTLDRDNVQNKFNLQRDQDRFDRDQRASERVTAGRLLSQPIPEGVSPEIREQLIDKRKALSGFLSDHDVSESDTGPAFSNTLAEYQSILDSIEPPSGAQEFEKGIVYVDESGKPHDTPGEGRTAFSRRTEKPLLEQKEQTVPFRGQQVPVSQYEKFYDQSVKAQEYYDAQSAAFPDKDFGERPTVLPSMADLLYPEQQPQQGAAQQSGASSYSGGNNPLDSYLEQTRPAGAPPSPLRDPVMAKLLPQQQPVPEGRFGGGGGFGDPAPGGMVQRPAAERRAAQEEGGPATPNPDLLKSKNIMKEAARLFPNADSIEDIPSAYRAAVQQAQKILDANRGGR